MAMCGYINAHSDERISIIANCVEIDREGGDLYLLRRYVNGFRAEISSLIRGSDTTQLYR